MNHHIQSISVNDQRRITPQRRDIISRRLERHLIGIRSDIQGLPTQVNAERKRLGPGGSNSGEGAASLGKQIRVVYVGDSFGRLNVAGLGEGADDAAEDDEALD